MTRSSQQRRERKREPSNHELMFDNGQQHFLTGKPRIYPFTMTPGMDDQQLMAAWFDGYDYVAEGTMKQ